MEAKRKIPDGTVAIPAKKARNELAIDVGSVGVSVMSVT